MRPLAAGVNVSPNTSGLPGIQELREHRRRAAHHRADCLPGRAGHLSHGVGGRQPLGQPGAGRTGKDRGPGRVRRRRPMRRGGHPDQLLLPAPERSCDEARSGTRPGRALLAAPRRAPDRGRLPDSGARRGAWQHTTASRRARGRPREDGPRPPRTDFAFVLVLPAWGRSPRLRPCRPTALSSSSTTRASSRASPRRQPAPAGRDRGAGLARAGGGGGWPELAPAYTPDGWASQFVAGLLDIDFARQSRGCLGAWLVAEEAPDLMPGIPWPPSSARCTPRCWTRPVTGQPPMPSGPQWQADAAAGVRWSVRNLHVQLDPQWQSMIAAGWQPVDLYASVEDVSGVLTVTQGASISHADSFSLVVQLGSAHWHPGYGTVLVGEVS